MEAREVKPARRFAYLNVDGTIRDFNGLSPAHRPLTGWPEATPAHVEVVQPEGPEDAYLDHSGSTDCGYWRHDYS